MRQTYQSAERVVDQGTAAVQAGGNELFVKSYQGFGHAGKEFVENAGATIHSLLDDPVGTIGRGVTNVFSTIANIKTVVPRIAGETLTILASDDNLPKYRMLSGWWFAAASAEFGGSFLAVAREGLAVRVAARIEKGAAFADLAEAKAFLTESGFAPVKRGGEWKLVSVESATAKELEEAARRLKSHVDDNIRDLARKQPLEQVYDPTKTDPVNKSIRRQLEKRAKQQATPESIAELTPAQELQQAATQLGYERRVPAQRAPFNSHGQPVFTDGDRFITHDVDSHIGGVWKMYNRKGKRLGTFDADLNRTALSENGFTLGGQGHEAFGQLEDFSG